MTNEQALKLAFELMAAAFKVADAFGQRKALKARLRAEMSAMFDDAEDAIERKHAGTRETLPDNLLVHVVPIGDE